MTRNPNQRLKLLYLSQILAQQTDEEHPLTVPQLIAALGKQGVKAERKSVYADLDALSRFGLDVRSRKGKSPGWFVGTRPFQLSQLQLLADAVRASRFIPRDAGAALIQKLERLASVHQAEQLRGQARVTGCVKSGTQPLCCHTDKLYQAIVQRRAVTFRCFDYDIYRRKVFPGDGALCCASPYGLIWAGEHCYLAAYDHQSAEMRRFRVDRMDEVTVTRLPRMGEAQHLSFDPDAYSQNQFALFGGEEVTVCLRGERALAGAVLDRFGPDTPLAPDGPEHFTATLPAALNPQFFGWLFGLGSGVTLISPPRAAAAFRSQLQAVSVRY